eukprot:Gb_16831 [translate_table: standard]
MVNPDNMEKLPKVKEMKQISTASPKSEKSVEVEARVMMSTLCKPWELGGHPRDFLVAHRSARSSDSDQYYKQDKFQTEKHEKMVAEMEAWNRKREIKEEMLTLLTRLHSTEKQRQHFQATRKYNHKMESSYSTDMNSPIYGNDGDIEVLSKTFIEKPKYLSPSKPALSSKSNCSSTKQKLIPIAPDDDIPAEEVAPPPTVAAQQEVEELDAFEERLVSLTLKSQPLPGSALSFP